MSSYRRELSCFWRELSCLRDALARCCRRSGHCLAGSEPYDFGGRGLTDLEVRVDGSGQWSHAACQDWPVLRGYHNVALLKVARPAPGPESALGGGETAFALVVAAPGV